jgi:hypothetical protein
MYARLSFWISGTNADVSSRFVTGISLSGGLTANNLDSIMSILTCDGDQTAYLEYCCNKVGSCLTPASAKPVAYISPKKESWYFYQSLQEHVQKWITRHVSNTENQRVVQKLYKCSVESSQNRN